MTYERIPKQGAYVAEVAENEFNYPIFPFVTHGRTPGRLRTVRCVVYEGDVGIYIGETHNGETIMYTPITDIPSEALKILRSIIKRKILEKA